VEPAPDRFSIAEVLAHLSHLAAIMRALLARKQADFASPAGGRLPLT
jgi:hypothetical protein